MPTVSGVTTRVAPGVYVTKWSPFNTTQSQGSKFTTRRVAHATIHVYGTFASKGTVTVQGSNDLVSTASVAKWHRLKAWNGTTILLTTGAILRLRELPNMIRPLLVSGTVTTTSITVKLINHDLRES